jgi:SpoVK/Ycf46/Vps4 family AAA+-type ATPase
MPCILLLDEFDALAKMRDDPHELGELKRVVNSLLQNIDLLPAGTIVVAATNHEHLLDPAVWRRFESHIAIGQPDENARRLLLDLYLPRQKLTTPEKDVIVKITEGLTAADIKGACDLMARELTLTSAKRLELPQAAQRILAYSGRNGSTGADRQWPHNIDDRIRDLRSRDADLFTYDVISRILHVSKGKISNVLRESKSNDARE